MKSFIRLSDYTKMEIKEIFRIADEIQTGKYKDFLCGKTIIMFFPVSSIRTRVTFEKGIYLMGGQSILFPEETLNKREDIRDAAGYLNNWADAVVVRHKEIELLEKMRGILKIPVINGMTDSNHPCEMLADMYALSKIRKDFVKDKYLFCGGKGNIGLAWKEAAKVMDLSFMQCCPEGYEMDGIEVSHDISKAMAGKDIICTDSFPQEALEKFMPYQINTKLMERANRGAVLNPCPPFYRGEEVDREVMESDYFVGYEFKKCLLEIQQAVIVYCLRAV